MSFIVGQKVISATGGTISTTTGYIVHTFTSSGTFTPSQNGTVEVLVVGAGGSSGAGGPIGQGGGGGGGGSVIYRKFIPVGAGVSYTVEIGQVVTPISTASTFTHPQGPITAPGGGKGGNAPGSPGVSNPVGSGGGGGSSPSGVGGVGVGIIGLGFPGGNGATPTGRGAGGGGGAGNFGVIGVGETGGNGGIGVSYSITGISSYYGSGGGGGGSPISGKPNNNISLPQVSIYGRGKQGGGPGSSGPNTQDGPGIVIIRYIN